MAAPCEHGRGRRTLRHARTGARRGAEPHGNATVWAHDGRREAPLKIRSVRAAGAG
ncbi:hypothetical protein GCWU000341_01031 [Oribacterium sp. oral taxon 078 str. F0262]|nr:hypothetical protein GCWU000341_01031 [Oribacterium sp. oral taxon 078 str. F0262]